MTNRATGIGTAVSVVFAVAFCLLGAANASARALYAEAAACSASASSGGVNGYPTCSCSISGDAIQASGSCTMYTDGTTKTTSCTCCCDSCTTTTCTYSSGGGGKPPVKLVGDVVDWDN